MININDSTIALAKSVDLVSVASALGYTPVKAGNCYKLKEMDSLRIFHRSTWYRFSGITMNGITGGSVIDFVMAVNGMTFIEAVEWLLDYEGVTVPDAYDQNPDGIRSKNYTTTMRNSSVQLPDKSDSCSRLYAYLINQRHISAEYISHLIKIGLIYESLPYHNVVFLGKDYNGSCRYAFMRGTATYNGVSFKLDVNGSDKNYGFNLVAGDSDLLFVFEGAIDLISFAEIYGIIQKDGKVKHNMLALGMLHDAPLTTFLMEHTNITTIVFGLDNDEPGRDAMAKLNHKYQGLSYTTGELFIPDNCKDFNDWLCQIKINKEAYPELERSMAIYEK